ncbi:MULTISPECIES: glycosyltransferase [Halorussus]|uniref:glycosyltransferase n=1 Tax=Halorussus TaxID=1070314 RepID=UPI00209E2A60|nr:hypothetical protein [Halorussus vallis]USZ77053.1 hypothetical protein NGM07_06930 [Halorussus vallis]
MDQTVAVAHYPEGAGHATRMLAIAQAFEDADVPVTLAGGGPGSRFIECNGYDVFRAAPVDYIGDYQQGSLGRVVTRSLPYSCKRVCDLARWLRREDPAALVTDDMFGAMAASLTGTSLYIVTHNAASYYDAAVEQVFTWLLNRYQLGAAEAFLYPAVWPPDDGDPPSVTHVPPIALDPPNCPEPDADIGVLVVPSVYSTNFDVLAETLRTEGHDVTAVGGDDWEAVPSLLPWIRAADVVVCSGYSTVMEAAVAGTPCVVYPFTDEQHGVTRVLERRGVRGFQVEHSIAHVARAVRHPPEEPRHENGVTRVADHVLGELT